MSTSKELHRALQLYHPTTKENKRVSLSLQYSFSPHSPPVTLHWRGARETAVLDTVPSVCRVASL